MIIRKILVSQAFINVFSQKQQPQHEHLTNETKYSRFTINVNLSIRLLYFSDREELERNYNEKLNHVMVLKKAFGEVIDQNDIVLKNQSLKYSSLLVLKN